VDQQAAIGLGPQQGFEDTVDLGVDGVAHGGRGCGGGRWASRGSVDGAAAARQARVS
jgi:hypothetical protein